MFHCLPNSPQVVKIQFGRGETKCNNSDLGLHTVTPSLSSLRYQVPATHLCIDAIDACVFPGNLQELQNDFKNTAFGEYVSFYLAGRAAHGMLQEEPGEFRHDKSECNSLASMVFSVHVLCTMCK